MGSVGASFKRYQPAPRKRKRKRTDKVMVRVRELEPWAFWAGPILIFPTGLGIFDVFFDIPAALDALEGFGSLLVGAKTALFAPIERSGSLLIFFGVAHFWGMGERSKKTSSPHGVAGSWLEIREIDLKQSSGAVGESRDLRIRARGEPDLRARARPRWQYPGKWHLSPG